jgi:hypothetical protein
LDILVDAPYIEEQRAPLLWRGSRNQTVHFLTSRYAAWRERVQGEQEAAEAELLLSGAEVTFTGFWPPELVEKVSQVLQPRREEDGQPPKE